MWAKIVCLDGFAVFSFLDLKVVRNRKNPKDLTETHESDFYLREQLNRTPRDVKWIRKVMRFLHHDFFFSGRVR